MKRLASVIAGSVALFSAGWAASAAAAGPLRGIIAGWSFAAILVVIVLILVVAVAIAWLAVARARRLRREMNRMSRLVATRSAAEAPPSVAVPVAASRQRSPVADEPGMVMGSATDADRPTPLEPVMFAIVSASSNRLSGLDLRIAGTPARRPGNAREERDLVAAAIDLAARRAAEWPERLALHVPVTRQFLSDSAATLELARRVRLRRDLSETLVLDLPLADLLACAPLASFASIARAGLRVSVSGAFDAADARRLRGMGVVFVRLPAASLASHQSHRRATGWEMSEVAQTAGFSVIADGVSETDGIPQLVDIGIDLMSGPAFPGPLKLRPTEQDGSRAAIA